jgi:hypothetical protein
MIASDLLTKLEEVQLLIIKAAEVLGVLIICVLGVRPHLKMLRSRNRRKKNVKPDKDHN